MSQRCLAEVALAQVGPVQAGARSQRAVQTGTAQVGLRQVGTGEVIAGQVVWSIPYTDQVVVVWSISCTEFTEVGIPEQRVAHTAGAATEISPFQVSAG